MLQARLCNQSTKKEPRLFVRRSTHVQISSACCTGLQSWTYGDCSDEKQSCFGFLARSILHTRLFHLKNLWEAAFLVSVTSGASLNQEDPSDLQQFQEANCLLFQASTITKRQKSWSGRAVGLGFSFFLRLLGPAASELNKNRRNKKNTEHHLQQALETPGLT